MKRKKGKDKTAKSRNVLIGQEFKVRVRTGQERNANERGKRKGKDRTRWKKGVQYRTKLGLEKEEDRTRNKQGVDSKGNESERMTNEMRK